MNGGLPSHAPEIESDEVLAQIEIWRTAYAGLQIDVVVVGEHAL